MVSGALARSQHAERRQHEDDQRQSAAEGAASDEDSVALVPAGFVAEPATSDADEGGEQDAGDDHQRPDTEREVQRFDYLSGGRTSGTQPSADHHVMYVRSR